MAIVSLRLTELPDANSVALTDYVYVVTNPGLAPVSNRTTVQGLANVINTGLPWRPAYEISAVPVRIIEGGTEASSTRQARDNLLVFNNTEYLRMQQSDALAVNVLGINGLNVLELGNALTPQVTVLSPILAVSSLQLTTPLSTVYGGVPPGGLPGQSLVKNSATDHDVSWQTATGAGEVPAGGTAYQILTKYAATDYATYWADSISITGALYAGGEIQSGTGFLLQNTQAYRARDTAGTPTNLLYLNGVNDTIIGNNANSIILFAPNTNAYQLNVSGLYSGGGAYVVGQADVGGVYSRGGVDAASLYSRGAVTVASYNDLRSSAGYTFGHEAAGTFYMVRNGNTLFNDLGGYSDFVGNVTVRGTLNVGNTLTVPKGSAPGAWIMGQDIQLIGADASNNVLVGGNATSIYLQRQTNVNGALTASTGLYMPIDIYLYGGGYPLIAATGGPYVDVGGWAASVAGIRLTRPTTVHSTLYADGIISTGSELQANSHIRMPVSAYLIGGGRNLIGFDGVNTMMTGPTYHYGTIYATGIVSAGSEVHAGAHMRVPQYYNYYGGTRPMLAFDGTYTVLGGPTWTGSAVSVGALLTVSGGITVAADTAIKADSGAWIAYVRGPSAPNQILYSYNASCVFNENFGNTEFWRDVHVRGILYKSGVGAYTFPDYVFEHAYTGQIEVFKDAPGAQDYSGRRSLREVEAHAREHWRLPDMAEREEGRVDVFRRTTDTLAEVEKIYLHLFDLNRRIEAMEAA